MVLKGICYSVENRLGKFCGEDHVEKQMDALISRFRNHAFDGLCAVSFAQVDRSLQWRSPRFGISRPRRKSIQLVPWLESARRCPNGEERVGHERLTSALTDAEPRSRYLIIDVLGRTGARRHLPDRSRTQERQRCSASESGRSLGPDWTRVEIRGCRFASASADRFKCFCSSSSR